MPTRRSFNDVALPAVFAHEFGHHIQYERGYFDDLPPGPDPNNVSDAEFTRYTELMADTFSAYYLTHSRGAALNRKRVAEFLEVFFQIGDCQFTSAGHHGTPIQRMRAATFGFNVADQAHKQGHILTAAQFHALFVANYTSFVAP
jgi:predicted metalloprotease